ncbi:MAG: phage portal protein, partial [Limosilactobacillus sp.]|nr:phage portal protein [Limosilactobacillus sp.]
MAEITGNGSVVKGNVFIFPEDEELTIEDLNGFINYHQQLVKDHYKRNYDIYIGQHEIVNRPDNDYGENNKLVVGMPRLLVDEYAGYFGGNPVTIQAKEDSDNDALQDWLKAANFDDEHSEVVKSVAIYGRAYLLEYLDDGKPQLAHVEPDEGFMIYDDTIKASPLAFVRYSYDKKRQLHGTLYFADSKSETGYEQQFNAEQLFEPEARVFHGVPAQEFYANEERQGVFDGAVTLINALDNALSRKANQVDYFDNAYLKLLGVQLSPGMDENGNPLPPQIDRQNRLIYSPDVEAPNADIDFVSKPDADGMQENLINRLIDMIYQTTMIPNFRDEAFGGN